MRYSGCKPNLSLIIGWCVAAVAIGMAASCNNSQTIPPVEGTGGTDGYPIVTAGVQTTGGTVATGGTVTSGENQGTGGTTGGNVGSSGTVGSGGKITETEGVPGTGGVVDNDQTGGTVEPAAGTSGESPIAGTRGDPVTTPSSNCGTADSVEEGTPGPFTPTHIENGGAGTSWVFYPEDIGRDGCKHPIFNWGPGAMTGPAQYLDHLNHLASHGFVIICQPSSGTGSTETASLTWLIEQNDNSSSPFYQNLDTTKVVMGGHSMGALTTFAMADDPRLTLYILVCGGSGSGATGAANIHAPSIILGGDTDSGTPNFRADYEAIKEPVIFLIKSGTDHIMCARNNLAPWTAFMRWQLYGEEKWKDDFFGSGKYCSAPWNSCESKNWP